MPRSWSQDDPPPLIGGKASSWWWLAQAGLPVPAGFCVAADEPVSAETLVRALMDLRKQCGAATVAVRSSGVGEDGAHQAMAGLFETLLDVPADIAAVLAAIERCREAGRSGRAWSATGGAVQMGVLIQQMIHPSRSGVLFTRDPHGHDAGMVVEVTQGHLRGLVDGSQDAARLTLGASRSDEILSATEDADLQRLGREIERLLGAPADIEWASVHGRIVILQARPITTGAVTIPPGLTLLPVQASTARLLPRAVAQHDKIALRLVAAELDIGISHGLVGLTHAPTPDDVAHAADALSAWGEFIAVLLDPFHLEGEIFRRFGAGRTAGQDLAAFVDQVAARHTRFAFLLKELQETASTGVALRLPDGTVRVELVEGHFATKGFADPTVYVLDRHGQPLTHAPGKQDVAVQVVQGRKVRVPVLAPPMATAQQLADVHHATVGLAERYPNAGIEFGFTPEGTFFLVDLYQSVSVTPPVRGDVLSEGRVVGRVRVLMLAEDAVEESIERHVHSRRASPDQPAGEAEILVVHRPYYVLDQLIYQAHPGTLGFICEGGALLCHLAVVMRERGVPGLVLPDAIREFVDGERIVLDTRPGSPAAITRH